MTKFLMEKKKFLPYCVVSGKTAGRVEDMAKERYNGCTRNMREIS